jgi:hypothetical protein
MDWSNTGGIDTLKGEGIRSASKWTEPRGNKGAALKLRCQNTDYRVNTGIG